ncbi:response regulator [Marinactinospora thermotolerans]|uniref:Two component transcriptional regulator, LuxR family n=1 Tax=Marinactinospora thermotolerans DSM 45154 TaxID=1122192 RepID=A0A1T4RP55_9ACTN|nr:response regulator transcription factor [Marinactinospora thermotolerans]SKA17780.1 two component transcriptional regulator, LuxR family [Marinactinospora thermotolerans DSM 45154]
MTPSPPPITVLAVDDNIVVRAGLISLLETADDLVVVGEAGDGAEAIQRARELRPDVALLDVRMPVRDGVDTVEELSELCRVIMLTHTEDPATIHTALQRGARGYLVHGHFTLPELSRALREVVRGTGSPLSPVAATAVLDAMRAAPESRSERPSAQDLGLTEREAQILACAARGLSNSAIAHELFLSEKTVKNHINRIFRKLRVGTRAAAIARWNGHPVPEGHLPGVPVPTTGPRRSRWGTGSRP